MQITMAIRGQGTGLEVELVREFSVNVFSLKNTVSTNYNFDFADIFNFLIFLSS